VWEGGFDEAAWGAAGGLSRFICSGTGEPAPNSKTNLSEARTNNQEPLEQTDRIKSFRRLSPAKLHTSIF
jgi:hypothetical protein